MRTQSNVDSETRPLAATEPGADTMSFRASSLDEAVALAEESLGSPVRVVSANRIRRGGIGGFFASDLGVEVSVALDEETIEQALERLVSETADDERSRWLEHRVTAAPKSIPAPAASTSTTTMPATMPSAGTVTAPVPVTGKSALAAPRRSSLGTPKSSTIAATAPMPAKVTDASKILDALTVGDGPKIADAVARIAQRDEEPSMVRVEEIIEELSFLTRGPVLAGTDGTVAMFAPPAPPTQRTVALPRLPPRPIDIARAASANAAASQAQAVAVQQERTRDFLAADAAALAAGETRPDVRVELEAEPAAEPSQRQVELAVAATDQLIESLQREGVRRMSVRIILRTGDQSAVEAEAEWEAS